MISGMPTLNAECKFKNFMAILFRFSTPKTPCRTGERILKEFKKESEGHISEMGLVISAGFSDFREGTDPDFRSVFERADTQMYENKKYLKSIGAETRL